MDQYQFCPITCRAVEIDTSSIESSDSLDEEFIRCGFTDDVIEVQDIVHLDLPHQFTLHLCPDINGILGDENGDSATFKSNVSAATIATSKTAPSAPIQYLVPCPKKPPSLQSSNETKTQTVIMSDTDKAEKDAEEDSPMTLSSIAAMSQVDPPVPQPPNGEASSNRPKELCDD